MKMLRIMGMTAVLASVGACGPAFAATITGQTSCADALRMQEQAGPQGEAELRQRIAVVLKTYAPEGLDGKGGMPSPQTTDVAMAYGKHWCQRHPDRTLADAARAAQRSQNKWMSLLQNAKQSSDGH